MTKMTGMNVQVYIKDTTSKVLAGQRNATLKRTANAIDATSKDTTGGWKESLQGFKEWKLDCDGAYIENDAAYSILETAFLAGTPVIVEIHFPSGTVYSGSASIADFSLELPYDNLVTYKIALDGSGALTKTP